MFCPSQGRLGASLTVQGGAELQRGVEEPQRGVKTSAPQSLQLTVHLLSADMMVGAA